MSPNWSSNPMVKGANFLLKFFEFLGNKVKDLEMGDIWFLFGNFTGLTGPFKNFHETK
jgi:hypothetical protein